MNRESSQVEPTSVPMECVEFEKLLQQRLDERLAPRCAELECHAVACSGCALLLEDACLLSRGVSAWRAQTAVASPELTTRVTEQVLAIIRSERPVRETSGGTIGRRVVQAEAPQTWQAWAVLAGTVAAVWCVFLGSTAQQQTNSHSRDVVRFAPPAKQTPPKADLGVVLVSAGGAYSHLATESLAAAQDFALLWPASSASTAGELRTPKTEAEESDWSPDLSDELSPISDSVEDAWKFLRRTVPQVEKMRT